MGSSLGYVLAASLYRMFERPFVVGGMGILAGYLGGLIQRGARYEDAEFRRYLRRFEHRSLGLGKRRTIAQYNLEIRRKAASTDSIRSISSDRRSRAKGGVS